MEDTTIFMSIQLYYLSIQLYLYYYVYTICQLYLYYYVYTTIFTALLDLHPGTSWFDHMIFKHTGIWK